MSTKHVFFKEIARKLCSRKLWLAIVAFVTGVLIMNGDTQEHADKIGGAIMSGAAVIAYCIGEGLADNSDEERK